MILSGLLNWLTDATHWRGTDGIPARTSEHLYYVAVSVALAALLAVPLGLYVGHTGRGGVLVVGTSNALRALPTLGLVTVLVLGIGLGQWPALIGLIVLAIPAILSGAYAGMQDVDRDVVDAARGMGMTGWQRLWQVEVPNALPLIIGGLRSAMLQAVATAAVAAFVGLGGLGRILLDGLKVRDYSKMLAAAVLIAVLAVVLDLVLAAIQRLLVPRGLVVAASATSTRRGGKNT